MGRSRRGHRVVIENGGHSLLLVVHANEHFWTAEIRGDERSAGIGHLPFGT